MANRWGGITIDCADPASLAKFWSILLGRPVSAEHNGPGWATVGSRLDELPRPTFQRVPEAKNGKVRLHIDAGRAQVEQLGGQWTGQRYDYPGEGVVIVMTDPESHEFCLVQYFQPASARAVPRAESPRALPSLTRRRNGSRSWSSCKRHRNRTPLRRPGWDRPLAPNPVT